MVIDICSQSNFYQDDEREPSPGNESQDVIELLPELAAIQKNVRATSAAPELFDNRSVELVVKWIPHPQHPAPYESNELSWTFNVPQVSSVSLYPTVSI